MKNRIVLPSPTLSILTVLVFSIALGGCAKDEEAESQTQPTCASYEDNVDRANTDIDSSWRKASSSISALLSARRADQPAKNLIPLLDDVIKYVRDLKERIDRMLSDVPSSGVLCRLEGDEQGRFRINNWHSMNSDSRRLSLLLEQLGEIRENFEKNADLDEILDDLEDVKDRPKESPSVPDSGEPSLSESEGSYTPEVPTTESSGSSVPSYTGGSTGSVAGTVFEANGKDPVSKATVYVPELGNAKANFVGIPKNQGDGTCSKPSVNYITMTCSSGSGKYYFKKLPSIRVNVAVQKGKFKINAIPITVIVGQTYTYSPKLPSSNSKLGSIPKIAVVSGAFDNLHLVLNKMNLEGRYDIYGSADQLMNSAALSKIDALMINCGTAEACVQPNKSLIRNFVANGGGLFVTDLSYDFVEQAFPEYIDFNQNDSVMNSAQTGLGGVTYRAKIANFDLKAALMASRSTGGNVLDPDGSIYIQGFSENWAQISSVNSSQYVLVQTKDGQPLTGGRSCSGTVKEKSSTLRTTHIQVTRQL